MSGTTADVAEKVDDDLAVIEGAVDNDKMEIAGIEVRLRRLKTRELLALMRVLSNGIGPGMSRIAMSGQQDQVVADLLSAMMVALPNAVEEFVAFVIQIVEPVNRKQQSDLTMALDNPEIDDLFEITERLFEQEADNLGSIVGKAQAMWPRLQKTYQNSDLSKKIGAQSDGNDGRGPGRST